MAGIATPFVPIALLIPLLVLFETNTEGVPFRAEILLTFGAFPGLILMLPTLIAAHFFNRRGRKGWVLSVLFGTIFGLLTGLFWDAGRLGEVTVACVLIGVLYSVLFWALSHGLASYAAQETSRP